jgi:histidinol-phosphate phosphatase family protein
MVIVVTNQSGVARGYFSEQELEAIHDRMQELFELEGVHIGPFYYCPHLPNAPVAKYSLGCDCRKPQAGMLSRASRERGLDLSRSVFIGESLRDIEAGHRAGCKTVLVLTGYGTTEARKLEELPSEANPDFLASDILGAVEWALEISSENNKSGSDRRSNP